MPLKDPFAGFEYSTSQPLATAPSLPRKQEGLLGKLKNKLFNSIKSKAFGVEATEAPGKSKERGEPEKFSSAIQKFTQKLGRTQHKFLPHREDAASKFSSNLATIRQSKCTRRTISYVDFRISEETDEDSDSNNEKDVENRIEVEEMESLAPCNTSGGKFFAAHRKASNISVMSHMSQASSQSRRSGPGFFNKGKFRPKAFGDSKADKLRYIERQNHEIFEENSNLYKQKRAKLNLERDMKWNGPHDDEFFRCFE